MRVQLALNVPDIDAAVDYYAKLFGVEPHKRRDGYANFAINEPPLKLVLFENPKADAHLNHIGVEVLEAGGVEAAQMRLEAAGILDEIKHETKCCHAVQEKLWSTPHNGLRWEWYRITDDMTAPGEDTFGMTCCTEDQKSDNIGAIKAD